MILHLCCCTIVPHYYLYLFDVYNTVDKWKVFFMRTPFFAYLSLNVILEINKHYTDSHRCYNICVVLMDDYCR